MSSDWPAPEGHEHAGGAPQRYGGYPLGFGGVPRTDTGAMVALALAVASFVAIPFVGAVAALVVARDAQDRIELSGGALAGEGLLTGARVIAWCNIALCLFAGLVILLLLLWIF